MNLNKLNKTPLLIFVWLMLFALNASAQTGSADGNSLDKKPLNDFADSLVTKWEKKEIDLTKSFSVVLDGSLTEAGKIDEEKSHYTKSEGDEDIVRVAKSAIDAVGKSGFLSYLSVNGINNFNLSLSQNTDKFSGILTSNMKSEKEALNISRSLSALFSIVKITQGMTDEEKTIIESFKKPFSESSQMILQFEMSKPILQEMINRNLKKASQNRQKYSQM